MEKLKDKILEKIKKGEIKMKPKLYFLLKSILFVLVLGFLVLFSFFLVSFIRFHLISSGLWYLPNFGPEGVLAFLRFLPWGLIIFSLVLILILEILSRKFSFKWPILVSLLVIILVVLFGSFIFEKTAIHERLFLGAKEGRMPRPILPIYLKYGMPKFRDFHRGIIERVATSSIFIKKPDGEILEVMLKEKPPYFRDIKEGEGVVIFGKKENGKIKHFKIRKIKDHFLPFERKLLEPTFRVK